MALNTLTTFVGLNNRLPDFALRPADGRTRDGLSISARYLRVANNVDIDDAGRVHRRNAAAMQQAMTGAHSLLMLPETEGFLVRDSVLYAITLPSYTETLLKLLSSDAQMSYVQWGDSWYFSNGVDRGRIKDGATYPIGLPTPDAPTTSVIGGSLLKGSYLIGISYINSVTGEEGGISALASEDLTDTGGIRVALPGVELGATHVNVYLSAANGTAPTLATTVTAATATVDLIDLATGREAAMRREEVLPAGTLFLYNGRLCSFAGSTVYVGLPFRPGYYLPAEGYIPFPATVSIAAPNQTGVYLVADKTYFVPGDLGDTKETIRDVLPYGAVAGTVFFLPDIEKVGWFSDRGFVIADTTGKVDTTMSENVEVSALPSSGTAEVYDSSGYRRVVACGYCMNLANNAVSTYTDWEFTSLSGCYGTKADGLYLTDAEGAVAAAVGLGKLDFGTEVRKRLPAVYLGLTSAAPMQLTVQTPNRASYTYTARNADDELQMQRIDPGKGLLATWYDLTLTNSEGAPFTLASVSFAADSTARRI